MQIIYAGQEKFHKSTSIGLGNFDGLHIGHISLINKLIEQSRIHNLNSLIYTFNNHPQSILNKKISLSLITTHEKKIQILKNTNLEYIYFDQFDEMFSKIGAEKFIKDILVDKLKMNIVVVGQNYRFGHKNQGDVKLLKQLGEKFGFRVEVIPSVMYDGELVSSTRIRKCISEGNVKKASIMLGRNYSINGVVIHGKGLANKMGIPTANIDFDDNILLPKRGVYVTLTIVGGVSYKSITNVGKNPTFQDTNSINIETHILDFNYDIYGENIEVVFIDKIRDEKKFESKEAFMLQITQDIKRRIEYNKYNFEETLL